VQRLSAVDALFVEMETRRMHQHVVAVLVLDPKEMPGGYSFDSIKAHFASRLDDIPAYRHRLVQVPFGLGDPLWVDDPDFDIDVHIRRAALPAPGGQVELAEFVADVSGRGLHRERPLWETWVVEGLEHGRIALVAKTHHSLMDGVTGADLISRLFDVTPEISEAQKPEIWAPPLLPSAVRVFVDALPGAIFRPAMLFRTSLAAARGVFGFAKSAVLRPQGTRAPAMPFSAPDCAFNAAISAHRTVAYGRASLDDLKLIKNAYGCTVNDVVLAACGLGLREWLRDHGGLPDKPLVATLPVSVQETEKVSGNKISTMFVRLPTNENDPVLALRAVQDDTHGAKELHQAMGAETIMELAEFAPRRLLNLATRLYSSWKIADLHRPIYNVIISNVPGPPMPLYLHGAELVAFYPHGPIFENNGLNITVMSYQGNVDIGVIGCRELVPDVEQIADGFVHAIDVLKAAAEQENAPAKKPSRQRPARSRSGNA
jgi:WS/DGAT/MGAT family acyltransferase